MDRLESQLVLTLVIIGLALVPVHAGLVSQWTFDTNFADSGPFANNGGDSGSDGDPAIVGASKIGPGALDLDGNDALFLSAGSGAEYTTLDDNGDGFTVASWVWIDPAASGTSRLLSTAMGGGFTGVGWGVGFDGTNMKATTYGKTDYNTAFSVPTASWNHVAYRFGFNGTGQVDTVEFFLNGQSQGIVDPGVDGMNNATGVYSIGNLNLPTGEQYFNGRIDEMRVYDKELTNDQILMLAGAPVGVKPYVADASTAFLAHLDEAQGASSANASDYFVVDASGNGNDLRTNLSVSPFDGVDGPAGLGTAMTQSGSSGKRAYRVDGATDTSVFNNELFTIDAWIRNPAAGTYAGVLRLDDGLTSTTNRGGIIQFGTDSNGDQLRIAGFNAAGSFVEVVSTATVTFEADKWYHIAVTFDDAANEIRFYFQSEDTIGDDVDDLTNGQAWIQLGSTISTAISWRDFNADGQGQIWLGEWGAAFHLNGDLDEVRWSNAIVNGFEVVIIPTPAALPVGLLGFVGLLTGRRPRRQH